MSFTAAAAAVFAAVAVVLLIAFAVPKPCRPERTIQAAQQMAGCSAPHQPFSWCRGMGLMPSLAVAVAAVLSFVLVLLFSAALPCRPDQTVVIGAVKIAGCSAP
jgi:hypothetical protein